MEHFKEYLIGGEFIIQMENNPLMYIMSTPNLEAIGHQWVATLAPFNFTLEYQQGKDNGIADALSRMPSKLDEETMHTIINGVVAGTSSWAKVFHLDLMHVADTCE